MLVLAHQQVVYAGFFRRLGAFAIDTLILSAILMMLVVTLFGVERLDSANALFNLDNWHMHLLEQGFPALWTIIFWVAWKATPGKLLMDCQVVDAKTCQKVPVPRLVLRYLAYILSSIPLGFGFIWILFDRRRQGWHDKIAGTVVIEQDESLIPLTFRAMKEA